MQALDGGAKGGSGLAEAIFAGQIGNRVGPAAQIQPLPYPVRTNDIAVRMDGHVAGRSLLEKQMVEPQAGLGVEAAVDGDLAMP